MPVTNPAYLREVCGAILSTALIVLCFRFCPRFFASLRRTLDPAAYSQAAVIIAVVLMPVVIRLMLLPWLTPPEPHIDDEFGHLLAADTLMSGCLANPPHPLWRHFETIYVLQQPTFASKYPLGQGLILATGKLATGYTH